MNIKTFGKKYPVIAVTWDGTNLEDVQEFLGEDYKITQDGAVSLLIHHKERTFEVLCGWYIFEEEYIDEFSNINYRLCCASPEIMSEYYDIID